MVAQDEATFLKTIDRIKNDIEKGIDAAAKKTSADSEVADFKKDELHASLLGLMNQYEMNHGLASQNPSFKVSKNFRDVEKKLEGDTDKMLRSQPIFRNYLLGKLSQDFQTFATANNKDGKALTSELFAKFINTKKDLSQLAKDYLLGFVLSSTDIQQGMPAENIAKLDKVIKDNVKDAEIKKPMTIWLCAIGASIVLTIIGILTSGGGSSSFLPLFM